MKEYFQFIIVFITDINAFKGASLLLLLVNLQVFGRALKTHVKVLMYFHI